MSHGRDKPKHEKRKPKKEKFVLKSGRDDQVLQHIAHGTHAPEQGIKES